MKYGITAEVPVLTTKERSAVSGASRLLLLWKVTLRSRSWNCAAVPMPLFLVSVSVPALLL